MGGGSDDFVNVWMKGSNDDSQLDKSSEAFYQDWMDTSSAKHSAGDLVGYNILKKRYPGHSITMSVDFALDLRAFPDCICVPINPEQLISNKRFVPPLGRGEREGGIAETIRLGGYKVAWNKYEFIWYVVQYPKTSQVFVKQNYILHEGDSQQPAQDLLFAAGSYENATHEEIWVYANSFWQKDHQLWIDLQNANWKDVILDENYKKKLQKDIYGFFESEKIYKDLAIAWKRGIIMYGPPGNGKTVSIKAIMKTCKDKGFEPLYVKNFRHYGGVEMGMETVFSKAREMSPCVVILEDLDALIDDTNRSFFLNQLDGISTNDGLLIIGTTNHFDRLDTGISSRPSRFDRKYLFDDPNPSERLLYVQYWQNKLKSNDDIDFPNSLANEIVASTDRFSFAYLKEVFVNTLVVLAGIEDKEKPKFSDAIKDTIKELRKQLGNESQTIVHTMAARQAEELNERQQKIHHMLDALSNHSRTARGMFENNHSRTARGMFENLRLDNRLDELLSLNSSSLPEATENETRIRRLLDALSEGAQRRSSLPLRTEGSNRPSNVMYDATNPFM